MSEPTRTAANIAFDPSIFERAAAAIREIDKSKNAARAFDLAHAAQKAEANKAIHDGEKSKAETARLNLKRAEVEAAEQRRNLALQFENDKATAEYKTRLQLEAGMRNREADAQRRAMDLKEERRLAIEKEALRKHAESEILAMRVAAAKKEKELQLEVERAKIRETFACMARNERSNKDIELEKLRTRTALEVQGSIDRYKLLLGTISDSVSGFINNPNTRRVVGGSAFAGLALYFGLSRSTQVAANWIDSWIRQPRLIRSYSTNRRPCQISGLALRVPYSNYTSLVFSERQIRTLNRIRDSMNLVARGAISPRHLLFYGPPGTGKTTFAASLAKHTGTKFAVCAGGDFVSVGKNGTKELHKLFDWASRSRRGVVLFIDEADAFLRKRDEDLTEELRGTLATFLARSGSMKEKVSIVFATNLPDALDSAVLDRVDEVVEFTLPALEERRKIAYLLLREVFAEPPRIRWWQQRPPVLRCELPLEEVADLLAAHTDGASGRQIEKVKAARRIRQG